jgi:hypothetical protein
MPRGIPNKPKLNDQSSEVIAKNFLEEVPTGIMTELKVVIAKEIPKMEKIVFINNRDPGTMQSFHYCSPTHPLKHYDLMHGLEYELPVEVIKLLEGTIPNDPFTCHSRIYSQRKNYEGMPENYVSGYKPYFQCRVVRA